MYAQHITLSFHLRSLRELLNIKRLDRVSNCRVLEMAGLTSVTTILSRRMNWLWHVYGMENTRIPYQCLFDELSSGQRSQSRQTFRYKDVCKDTMKNLEIDPKSWERMASDRAAWKTTVCAQERPCRKRC